MQLVFPFLEELHKRGHCLTVRAACPFLLEKAKKMNWPHKQIKPGRVRTGMVYQVYLTVSFPASFAFHLFQALLLKHKHKINTLICQDAGEKCALTLPASFAGLNVLWLETPDQLHLYQKPGRKKLLLRSAKQANLIIPNTLTGQLLDNCGAEGKNRTVVLPGIKTGEHEHQDDIFSNLARKDRQTFNHRFFTLITEAELDRGQDIKCLLQAVSKCLSVIPHLQLMVVGDGPERKNLIWLSQKLRIDNLVWFVGRQAHLGKWLEDSHIFAASRKHLDIPGLSAALEAAYYGVPVITCHGQGLEDFVVDRENGLLLETWDSESLAQAIIRLQQNSRFRHDLGASAQSTVINRFKLEQMVDRLEALV